MDDGVERGDRNHRGSSAHGVAVHRSARAPPVKVIDSVQVKTDADETTSSSTTVAEKDRRRRQCTIYIYIYIYSVTVHNK